MGCGGAVVVVVAGSCVVVVPSSVVVVGWQSGECSQFGSAQSLRPLPSSSTLLSQTSQERGSRSSSMQRGGPGSQSATLQAHVALLSWLMSEMSTSSKRHENRLVTAGIVQPLTVARSLVPASISAKTA